MPCCVFTFISSNVSQGTQTSSGNIVTTWWREYATRSHSEFVLGSEPLTDAQLYEPIPYRSAVRENCTHVIALRTKPDDVSVTSKMSFIEKMIMSRFFGRKLGLPHLVSWMANQVNYCIRWSLFLWFTVIFCISIPSITSWSMQRTF